MKVSLSAFKKVVVLNIILTTKSGIFAFLIVFLFLIPQWALSENADTVKVVRTFSGSATLTTKGLKIDANDGFYINSTLSANRRNFPFSISSTINYRFESTIPGDDFLWNLNLTYTFGGKYTSI